MQQKKRFSLALALSAAAAAPLAALAHEAYVLPRDEFWRGIHEPLNPMAIQALKDPTNLHITLLIFVGTCIALGLNFLFRSTPLGAKVHAFPERFAFLGPIFVRAAIAGALFFGAMGSDFLGPELQMGQMPFPSLIRWSIIAASVLIAVGFLTEIAAIVALAIFAVAFAVFGSYLFTYFNYFGELLVLALFGMRKWSVDARLFGALKRWTHWEKYGTTIVRVCYGFALLFAGITVKFLHPELTMRVVNEWHLTQFHLLFPSDPLLVTLGGGLAEAAIGIFIIFGFEMRLTVLISLFYITLSLLYFRELVWPHLLLYGISLNLLVQPEVLTLDHMFFDEHRKKMPWWHRPFKPHQKKPLLQEQEKAPLP